MLPYVIATLEAIVVKYFITFKDQRKKTLFSLILIVIKFRIMYWRAVNLLEVTQSFVASRACVVLRNVVYTFKERMGDNSLVSTFTVTISM